jgi:hypothetical protein
MFNSYSVFKDQAAFFVSEFLLFVCVILLLLCLLAFPIEAYSYHLTI